MKKLPLLLLCTVMLTAVPATAQAKGISNDKLVSIVRAVQYRQKIKYDRETVTRNILKSMGVDDELIDAVMRVQKPDQTAKPTVKPTVKPTEKPTQKPADPTKVPAEAPTEAPEIIVTAAPTVEPTAVPTVKPTVKPTAAPTVKPTVKPTAVPTVKPTAKPTAVPTQKPSSVSSEREMEQEVLRLVNEERAKYGLSALTWAEDLADLARAHSADMIRRSFFDHTNPDGQSPFDRMRSAGIKYRSAGENIAYGQRSAAAVMNAWMNSSGHRANILNSSYKELGVGAVKNSGGTIYWTQEFVSR